jgi:hypothetical protein
MSRRETVPPVSEVRLTLLYFQDDWTPSDVACITPSPQNYIYSQPALQSNTGSIDQQLDRILQAYDQFQCNLAFSDTQMQTLNHSNQDAATTAQVDDLFIAVHADAELTQGFTNSISTQSPEHNHHDIQDSFWHSMSGNPPPQLGPIYHPNTDDARIIEFLSTADSSSWQYNFDQRTRDSLIMTLSQDGSYHLEQAEPDFMSLELMNLLSRRFLALHDRKLDSWIHSATLKPQTTTVELAGMIIAAAAMGGPIQSLQNWGYSLHKHLQPIIFKKVGVRRL